MIKKSTLALFVSTMMLAYACNNAGSGEQQAADSSSMDHSAMHHDSVSMDVPPVPDVPANAHVFFKNLKNGQTVTSPFKVEMGVENMNVDTAKGQPIAGSGHHHLLIDSGDSLATGTVVPKDSTHLHFGNAQTETELNLAPGKHHLTLQFADGLHRSYGSKLAASIDVTVKK